MSEPVRERHATEPARGPRRPVAEMTLPELYAELVDTIARKRADGALTALLGQTREWIHDIEAEQA